LAGRKVIFTTNCAACHRAGRTNGPNLTDDKWILGGGIKNVFHTLVNGGRDGKMNDFLGTLKPKEMQKVSSYILSLKDSNPKDPKAPEGEVWVDDNIQLLNKE
jgi:cytochrome c oxidase cbb3-type subunit 3